MNKCKCLAGIVLVVTAVSAFTASHAHADVLPPDVETVEIMMESLVADVQGIGRAFGVDEDSPLTFVTAFDAQAKTFSYSLDPDTTYMGMPLTLEGGGVYNDDLSRWEGAAIGSIGDNDEWQSSWDFELTRGDDYSGVLNWIMSQFGLDYHGELIITEGATTYYSSFDGVLTVLGVPVGSVSGTDWFTLDPLDGHILWEWTGLLAEDGGGNIGLACAGEFPYGGPLGYATVGVTPEPSSLGLLALGGLATLRRRCVQHA